jgi:hypothetical protein
MRALLFGFRIHQMMTRLIKKCLMPRNYLTWVFLSVLLLSPAAKAQLTQFDWFTQESANFTIIYREPHAYLAPLILGSAERVLAQLTGLFNYEPSEKIVINTYDFSDYGAAGTTTLPHNFIRLEIEPLELGYENIPYNERINWLITHELVHVVVNDLASNSEELFRSMFSKVPPEKDQPLSILYSLLTSYSRYTPRWHQEGIAVFLETWLTGGYGRVLGNFDEMFFRTMVLDNKTFPTYLKIDTKLRHDSFLLDLLYYLYGGRFASYLASKYGPEKLLLWYGTRSDKFNRGYETEFKSVFGPDLHTAWQDYIRDETQFQEENIRKLKSAPPTPIIRLQKKPMGWVTQPYADSAGTAIIIGNHQAHYLTSIKTLNVRRTGVMDEIGSIPTPSLIQLASTAYDENLGLFFYTTNNNQLYRDIWVLNAASKKTKLLFRDARVGQLTVSPVTHELWGMRHAGGKAALVYSAHPYRKLVPMIEFEFGDVLQHLSISPTGGFLAATLHQSSGRQAIVVADVEILKKTGKFSYQVISEDGSPEFPSWSPDQDYLYWNAYSNGVSNIYRYHRETSKIEAMSHGLTGLFRPVYLNVDSLFALEFHSDGFVPVILPNRTVNRLPAIRYYGQRIVDRYPSVTELALNPTEEDGNAHDKGLPEKQYRGLSNLQIHSFIPVLSGFQSQKVVGIFAHIADPLFTHDLRFEGGVSPFNENPVAPKTHVKAEYQYKRRLSLGIEHNAPNFYDLFNDRKQGMIGTRVKLGYVRYWKYDNPHKIKQTSELAAYRGIEAINDNLVKVSQPDFLVFQTSISSRNIRRAIGSVDSEVGAEWMATLMSFGVDPSNLQIVGGIHVEYGRYLRWALPHNVLHLKLAAGLRYTEKQLAIGRFYFGGFGNRGVDKENVKQYRKAFRFPGMPIYSLDARRFAKIMIEQNLPPLHFGNVKIGQHFLSHADVSFYSQSLIVDGGQENKWVDLGTQINFLFKHWFNLESTLSAGIAQAWSRKGRSWEWFVSLKLLKN